MTSAQAITWRNTHVAALLTSMCAQRMAIQYTAHEDQALDDLE
jgi:hypothetical protein